MSEAELVAVVAVAGAVSSAILSIIKRFKPDLSDVWKAILLLVTSLITVWGYEIYNVGFDQLTSDPWGTALRVLAVTGSAVTVYQLVGKPTTLSPRIEGATTDKK